MRPPLVFIKGSVYSSDVVTIDLDLPCSSATVSQSASKFGRKKVDKMDLLLDRAVTALSTTTEQSKNEDKWEIFGKLVATSLRELEGAKADKAQLDIHNVLYNAKYV